MITDNLIAQISPSLITMTKRLREQTLACEEFEHGDEAILHKFMDTLDQAHLLFAELEMAEESISTNELLSSVGKTEEMSRIVADIQKRLGFVQKKADERRNAFETERQTVFSMPTASGDPLVTFFKEQEQRTRLRALPMEQQMRVYQEAVRRGESTVQRAVKDPAFTAEMLAEKQFADFVARVDKEHVEHGKPEQWARLQTLEKTAGWLQTLAGAIEGLMSGYGQMPAFKANPVGKMDLSLTDQTRAPKKKAAIDTAPAGGVQALK